MSDDSQTVLKATPTDAKLSEQDIATNFFVQHEGQIDGLLSADATAAMRARQKSRARVMGLLLGAAAILFFAITIVKTGAM